MLKKAELENEFILTKKVNRSFSQAVIYMDSMNPFICVHV